MFSVFRCSSPPGSNVYFINSDPAVIIDTGHPASAKQTLDILKQSVPTENIGYILCTHAHGDHIGNASVFQKAFRAKTMTFRPEANFKLTDTHKLETGLMYDMPEINSYLEPEMEIALKNDTIRVIHTPGHADEHCCFYFTKKKFLFTGDLIAHEDTGFLNLNKPYTKALEELKQSVERCAALETSKVFTGHGDPYRVAPWQKIKSRLLLFERNPTFLIPHTLISPFLFHLWAIAKPEPIEATETYITDHAYLFDGFLDNCTPDLILQEFRKLAQVLTIRGVVKVIDNCYVSIYRNGMTWHWHK
jgi:glyoxylase-like metal-dependent hydrolase (beta-lactamase superfamily II)